MRRLLVLRPEPGATATLERARQRGLKAVAVPLFEIEPVSWELPELAEFDGLLLTGANAVRCAGERLDQMRGLPVYAVGDATAEVARNAGFDISATGDEGVDRLLSSIEPNLDLLHLCGEDRREPSEYRQRITPLPIYRAKAFERPDLGATAGSVALIHSPHAGRRFAELIQNRGSTLIAAISRAAADAVGQGWETVESACEPNDEALLALAARLCNTSAPE